MGRSDILDSVVESIVKASDEQDALHLLTCDDDVQEFYLKTLKYRVKDEFPFYYKMLGFKDASKSKPLPVTPKKDELLLFINELKKIVQELWPDSGALPPKAAWLFGEITSLQAAVESNDSSVIEYCSSFLWDEDRTFEMGGHRFRKALAELSGADFYKVQLFEKFLLSVVRHRRWFNTLAQAIEEKKQRAEIIERLKGRNPTQSSIQRNVDDALGLEIVRQYLDANSYVPLQFPWLSDFLSLMIFDGLLFEANYSMEQEEPLLRFREHKSMPSLINNLTLFRDEICARHYDAQELARRLRHMEDTDCRYTFPSLIYPLLATHSKGAQ
jgi:hypothetical protein